MSEESEATTDIKLKDLLLGQSITIASVATAINQQLGFKSNTQLAEHTEKIAFALVEVFEKTTNTDEKAAAEMKGVILSATQLIRLMDTKNKDVEDE